MQASAAESKDDRPSEEELLAHMMYALVRSRLGAIGDWGTSFRLFLSAATDTTSSALSRIVHLLALHPDIQDKLRKELKEACDDNEELPHDRLVSLPFLEAVCRETLRLRVNSLGSPDKY